MTLYNGTQRTRTAALMLRHIPRDLRDLFKAYCARRGKAMNEAVIEFMTKCIKEERIVPRKRKVKK
jgi:hypothetical protein